MAIKKSGAVLITKSQAIVTRDFTFTEPEEWGSDLPALKWAAARIAYEIERLETPLPTGGNGDE